MDKFKLKEFRKVHREDDAKKLGIEIDKHYKGRDRTLTKDDNLAIFMLLKALPMPPVSYLALLHLITEMTIPSRKYVPDDGHIFSTVGEVTKEMPD